MASRTPFSAQKTGSNSQGSARANKQGLSKSKGGYKNRVFTGKDGAGKKTPRAFTGSRGVPSKGKRGGGLKLGKSGGARFSGNGNPGRTGKTPATFTGSTGGGPKTPISLGLAPSGKVYKMKVGTGSRNTSPIFGGSSGSGNYQNLVAMAKRNASRSAGKMSGRTF